MERPAWLRRRGADGAGGGGRPVSSIVGMIAIGVLVVAVIAVLLGYGDEGGGDGTRADGSAAGGSVSPSPSGTSAGEAPSTGPTRVPIGPGAVEGTVRDLRSVHVYEEPRLGSDRAMSLGGGDRVIVTCQRDGPATYYGGRRSEVWVHIVHDNRVGYVPAVYVDTSGDVTEQVTACS